MAGSKSGTEYVFEHIFKNKSQAEVYQGVLDWLKGENGAATSSDGTSTIIAIMGSRRIFGSEHPYSLKNMIFVIAPTAEGVVVTATMTHGRTAYDSQSKRRRVKAGWGYLAEHLWASIEGGELAKKVQRPIAQQKAELQNTERRVKRKIALWSVVEILLIVGEFFLGGDVHGDVVSDIVGIAWLAILVMFFVLLLPLAIWLGILTNVRYALKRIEWREGLGLKY
ncbi:MAG: hypothetical protein LUO79_00930 [Methanomassiliicoccales archaeon]|nr:hypothetical protein [Methanomassiliicoccales archaeon]